MKHSHHAFMLNKLDEVAGYADNLWSKLDTARAHIAKVEKQLETAQAKIEELERLMTGRVEP